MLCYSRHRSSVEDGALCIHPAAKVILLYSSLHSSYPRASKEKTACRLNKCVLCLCRPTDDDTGNSPEASKSQEGQKHLSSLAVAGMTLGAVIGCTAGEHNKRPCNVDMLGHQDSENFGKIGSALQAS